MVPRFVPAATEVPQAASGSEPAPASRRGKLFYASIAMLIAIAFLAGILAGLRLFSPEPAEPRTKTPATAPAPPQTAPAKSDPAVPPAGMAYVPGGEFMMGSDLGDPYSRPAHPVAVDAFFIDITEVTNEAYKKFVDATGHQPPSTWVNGTFREGESLMPVTGVNWTDANAYAKWAGKRLPTEAEWEYAARGSDGRIYPWGDKWVAGYANAGIKATGFREVGSGGRSPFGLYDMAGNAWEWTSTDSAAYPGGKAFEASDRSPKIIRGGSWKSRWTEATAVNRAQWGAEGESDYSYSGFRCARDIIAE